MTGCDVKVVGVTKSFGGVRALRGVDLDVRAGEVHGILGPNGSGKSTLMKIIAGLQPADSGTVAVGGAHISSAHVRTARRAGVVLMPQELATVARFSVMQNICMGVEPSASGFLSRRAARRLAEENLERVGLHVDVAAPVADLTPTQQRLLMMAGALAGGARVLILDEPTAGLPVKESAVVVDAVKRLRDTGCTVLLVTHRLDQLRELSDSITVLRDGSVTARFADATPSRSDLVAAISDPVPAGRTAPAERPPRRVDVAAEAMIELHQVQHGRLRELSLTVTRGELVGVLGLPGSGIEELVELLSGERRPERGRLQIGPSGVGIRTPYDAMRAGVTFVTGDRRRMVMGDRSTATHVGLPSMHRRTRLGMVRERSEQQVTQHALDVFGVTASPKQSLATLSGGNQQRALMARCVASSAEVIVAHEPTVGIDVHAREVLRGHLVSFAQEHAVVVLSADPEEVVGLCQRVVCLRDGAVGEVVTGQDTLRSESLMLAIA